MKSNLMQFALTSMDALQNWFFWTWKIGPSAVDNSPRSPFWSYQLGLENGWMPPDPRAANGACGAPATTFDGTFTPYQTGGGTGVIVGAAANPWPPTSIGGVGNPTLLPTYTSTVPISTLPTMTFPAPTPGASPFNGGDGWFDDQDTAPGVTTVAGCTYPNPWAAESIAVPPLCTAASRMRVRKREPEPLPTITHL